MTRNAGAGQPQGNCLKPWEQDALEALRRDWDTAYRIGYDEEHGWYAARRDQIGALITTEDPDALRREIADDYVLMPVPREPRARAHADQRAGVLGADAGELLTESAEP
jgi:hypothetical protein